MLVGVEARSARRRLLFRGRRHGHVAEGQLELPLVETSAGLDPVLGRELEIAVARPVRQDADDVGEVALDVEAVELARGDEREEVGRSLGVVARAEEEPRLAPDGDGGPQGALGVVVLETKSPVIEEATKSVPLPDRVPKRGG